MLNKKSAETWVHKTDYNNVGALLNALMGLGLLATGTGMTVRGIKSLRNRVTELPMATVKRPSRFVQRQDKLKKILLNPDYTSASAEELPEDSYPKTASANVEQYRNYLEKEAAGDDPARNFFFYLWPGNWSKIKEEATTSVASKIVKDLWYAAAGRKPVDVADPRWSSSYKAISDKAPWGERVKGQLAAYPGFRSLWFLPGATAAVGLGYIGGDRLMSGIDDLLGSAKMQSVYKDKAEKIYQKSVKYLQDAAAGRIKTKKDDDSERVKEGSFYKQAVTAAPAATAPHKPNVVETGLGSSGFLFNANILLALILAGLTARQIKGGIRGYDAAKSELADRTHLQRAFQAARREREGDYNGLHLEMDPEPVLTPMDKSLSRKTNKLVSDTERNVDPMLRYENYQMERIRGKQDSIW